MPQNLHFDRTKSKGSVDTLRGALYNKRMILWRVCFAWVGTNALDVEIVDYH